MNREYYYELLDDGYYIKDRTSNMVYHQYEPFIPYPELGYEGRAKKQIEDIIKSDIAAEEARKKAEEEERNRPTIENLMREVKDLKTLNSEQDDMIFEQSYEIAMLKLNTASNSSLE